MHSIVTQVCGLCGETAQRQGRIETRSMSIPNLANKDKKNYLIHQLYVRQDFDECLKVIENVLEESGNLCEYALFTKALIKRHNGAKTAFEF